jgi:hypothetical protein
MHGCVLYLIVGYNTETMPLSGTQRSGINCGRAGCGRSASHCQQCLGPFGQFSSGDTSTAVAHAIDTPAIADVYMVEDIASPYR